MRYTPSARYFMNWTDKGLCTTPNSITAWNSSTVMVCWLRYVQVISKLLNFLSTWRACFCISCCKLSLTRLVIISMPNIWHTASKWNQAGAYVGGRVVLLKWKHRTIITRNTLNNTKKCFAAQWLGLNFWILALRESTRVPPSSNTNKVRAQDVYDQACRAPCKPPFAELHKTSPCLQ